MSRNLLSAEYNKYDTLNKLLKEVKLGRMLGPFTKKPISNLRVSPIGLTPKDDGTWRLITNLSHPLGNSVNDFIDPELCRVQYSSFDKVITMISNLGKGALCGKIDIKSAFRLLIVSPSDFDLVGIYFDGKFYIDKCLPMGCSLSCSLFEKFSSFLQWAVVRETGLNTIDHYLDDFFFAGSSSSSDCQLLMDGFISLAKIIGVPLAENKTTGPTTVLRYLGFEIDTLLMMIRIQEKIDKLRSMLQPIILKKKVKVKHLESLTGLMAFCSKALPSSRAFIRRFYDILASIKVKKPYYKVKINNEMKCDAQLWLQFLEHFNGVVYFPEKEWVSNETLQLFTDSTGCEYLRCGAYAEGNWAQLR